MAKAPPKFELPPGMHGWNQLDITWAIDPAVPTELAELIESAARWAMDQWASVCAIHFIQAPPEMTPNILILGEPPIKQPAYSEIPNKQTTMVRAHIDLKRAWAFGRDPELGELDLGVVLLHECGHWLGLNHADPGNVMHSAYSAKMKSLKGWDIAEAQLRYGPRVEPLPTDHPGGEVSVMSLPANSEAVPILFAHDPEAPMDLTSGEITDGLAMIDNALSDPDTGDEPST